MISGDNDSLDLLLDTITNTFGGILFIALLVVILASMSRPRPSNPQEETVDTPQITATDIEATQHKLQTLENVIKLHDESSNQDRSDEHQKLVYQVTELESRIKKLESEHRKLKQDLKTHQITIESRKDNAQALDTDVETVEREIEKLGRILTQKKKTMTITGSAPILTQARTSGVACIIRYGKLYFPDVFNASGDRRVGVNVNEMVVLSDSDDEIVVTPNPNRGTDASDYAAVLARFRSLPPYQRPSNVHITVCLWPDSFAQFQTIKRSLVESGYRYRLILTDQGVVEGNVSPGDIKTQ